MDTLLAMICFLCALVVPIIGGKLMDEAEKDSGSGAVLGIYVSFSMATIGFVVLGIRCLVGHW